MRGLIASVLAVSVSVGPAAAEGSICTAVAGAVRPGSSPPAGLEQLPGLFASVGPGLDAQKEAEVISVLQTQGATAPLMAQVKAQAGCDMCAATLTWFAGHTAAIVRNEAGSLHCVATVSLRSVRGHLEPVAVPKAFDDDCPDTALLADVSGRQVYLAQEHVRPDRDPGATSMTVDRLILSRWTGASWEQPCQVRGVYPMRFFELHLNCADGFDCGALRRFAVTDAAAAQDEQGRASAVDMDATTRRIGQFADRYAQLSSKQAGDLDRFPDFRSKPHGLVFLDQSGGLDGTGAVRSMRDRLFGSGTLVSLVWPEPDAAHVAPTYPSWVVTEWLDAGGTIRPVAGFVVHQKPGPIGRVSAGPA